MTTKKQAVANALNAKRSTGPRTPEGKAVAKLNAVKHGLLAKSPVLADEDPEQYNALREVMVQDLNPCGVIETILVERLVSITWRLRRLAEIDAGMFHYNQYDKIAQQAKRKADGMLAKEEAWFEAEAMVHQVYRVVYEPGYEHARNKQQRAENARDRATGATATAFLGDCGDGFARLHRYEAGLEKCFYKALHELQTLQPRGSGAPQR